MVRGGAIASGRLTITGEISEIQPGGRDVRGRHLCPSTKGLVRGGKGLDTSDGRQTRRVKEQSRCARQVGLHFQRSSRDVDDTESISRQRATSWTVGGRQKAGMELKLEGLGAMMREWRKYEFFARLDVFSVRGRLAPTAQRSSRPIGQGRFPSFAWRW